MLEAVRINPGGLRTNRRCTIGRPHHTSAVPEHLPAYHILSICRTAFRRSPLLQNAGKKFFPFASPAGVLRCRHPMVSVYAVYHPSASKTTPRRFSIASDRVLILHLPVYSGLPSFCRVLMFFFKGPVSPRMVLVVPRKILVIPPKGFSS
jgi:hypothetical protein